MSSVKVIKVNFEWLDISVLPAFRFFLIFFLTFFFCGLVTDAEGLSKDRSYTALSLRLEEKI